MPKQPVITIIPADNKVVINGEAYTVDCNELKGIHAIQYCFPYGEIEYVPSELRPDRIYKSNSLISDISIFQKELDAWKVAKQEYDAQKAKIETDRIAAFKTTEEAAEKAFKATEEATKKAEAENIAFQKAAEKAFKATEEATKKDIAKSFVMMKAALDKFKDIPITILSNEK
jgi:hypothetical protein